MRSTFDMQKYKIRNLSKDHSWHTIVQNQKHITRAMFDMHLFKINNLSLRSTFGM